MKLIRLILPVAFLILSSGCDHNVTAPPVYKVRFETSKGDFVVEVHRDWSPNGADRFFDLVKQGFYNDSRFFRVVPGFVVQWGLNKDPKVNADWREKTIPDDPVVESNRIGYITFAKGGPNTRTTQVFINLADNARLDGMGFPPFGKVIKGMGVVETINSEYGESPQQPLIQSQGNEYLNSQFPKLDFIKTAQFEQ